MGFHLRKSYNLGGIRLNLSNSGVGFSSGVKGLRVGIDGKGRSYIGGGKGILRYRKYAGTSNAENNDNNTVNSNKSRNDISIPDELKYFSHRVRAALFVLGLIITSPLLFLPFVYLLIAALMFYKCFYSKKIKRNKLIADGIALYNSDNLNDAVICLKEARSLHNEYRSYLDETVLNWYISAENYQEALIYINDMKIENKCIELIAIYYGLKQWENVINEIQQNYTQDEINNEPVLTGLFADAFLNLNQYDTALNVLMQSGFNNKRKMNEGMCLYRYVLGKCYTALNDNKKAIKQFEKVYAYDADYEDVKEKLESCKNDKN